MGDVIKKLPIRSGEDEKPRPMNCYFDTGSPYTFVKKSAAGKLKVIAPLSTPRTFKGLGNGRFKVTHIVYLELKLLGFWCSHYGYVIDDSVIDQDVLAGHDFMQKFNVGLDLRKKKLVLDRASLKRAQTVRNIRKEQGA
ncbi:MAG: hypothetical protein AB1742_10580 [bacterium]